MPDTETNPLANKPRSVSQTEQYEKCAWALKLKRIDHVVPRPAAWSHHGTAFHAVAEAFELSGRTMGEEEAVQLFSDRYSALVNKSLNLVPNTDVWMAAGLTGGEDIERRYVLGQQQVREYLGWAEDHPTKTYVTPDGKPGLELHFLVELGGVKVQGYIDQLVHEPDGSVRPRDWKTGSTKSKFQLETYAIAVRKVYGETVNRADWYLAKEGRLSRALKLEDLKEHQIADRYAEMDAGVKRGDFPASPGFQCRFCDVSHACIFRK
ncbi:RecB family exonuclease [Streptomyces wuyuanensis]|uniref:RecB family exonuclease n=1 Tax=Streptomyces wuyuanensis TaxID=1196353 RepID=UPI0034204487